MKLGKRLTVAAAVVATLALSIVPAFASSSLTYYVINGLQSSTVYSNNFTPTNASNVVTIKGYQTTNDNANPASVQYSIYQYGYFSDTLYGSTRIVGNSTQGNSASWYSHSFTGISPNQQYYLSYYNAATVPIASGAGNAYDGY